MPTRADDKRAEWVAWPRTEILAEYQAYYADLLRLNPGKREFIEARYAPDRRHRWSVTLDCGCVTQALTTGEDRSPADGSAHRLFRGSGLASEHVFVVDPGPAGGCLLCSGHGDLASAWSRRITACEQIGPLTWPGDHEQPPASAQQRRLREAEARMATLRAQLAQAQAEVRKLAG
jgi:hypothetical protein